MRPDNRFLPMAYGLIGAASFWTLAHSGPALAQLGGSVPAFLRLQGVTPGTQQTGHANISGTAIAGQFQGGGAGLTNLNASNLSSGAVAPARLTIPLALSGLGIPGVIAGTNTSTVGAGVFGESTSVTGTTYGVQGTMDSPTGAGVIGTASANSGVNYGVRGRSDSTLGSGVYGNATASSGDTNGVYGRSDSTTGRGVYGYASNATQASYGGYFETNGVTGAGVFGEALSSTGTNYGGRFRNNSTTGGGLSASALSTTGTTYGGRFENNSTAGRGVFGWTLATTGTTWGAYGRSDSNSGVGVRGFASANTGLTVGGDFESESTSGVGVNGVASATTGSTAGGSFETNSPNGAGVVGRGKAATGDSYGVFGISDSTTGIGVYATATASADSVGVYAQCGAGGTAIYATSNSNIENGFGIYAQSYSTDSGNAVRGYVPSPTATRAKGLYGIIESDKSNNYGVLGQGQGTTSWGVYAFGNSGATGTKSFRIDYPLDPTNKYLLHYSTESPTPQNFYTGNVVTDSQGKAWVTLPEYFHEINVNFKYQLTVVDNTENNQFVQVKVAREIANGKFLVMSSAPNTKVSWRVDADRNDLFVRAQKPKDVVMKEPEERGKYQSPELYGKPKSAGSFYEEATVRKDARLRARMAGATRP